MKGFYKVFEYKSWDYTNTFRMKGGLLSCEKITNYLKGT